MRCGDKIKGTRALGSANEHEGENGNKVCKKKKQKTNEEKKRREMMGLRKHSLTQTHTKQGGNTKDKKKRKRMDGENTFGRGFSSCLFCVFVCMYRSVLAETSERVGRAGSLLRRARIITDAFGKLSVAFAQVMCANVASLHLPVSRD